MGETRERFMTKQVRTEKQLSGLHGQSHVK